MISAPLVRAASTTTTHWPSAATIRFRAGNRHGAGGVPGGYSEITAPSARDTGRERRVRARVVDVDAAAEHGHGAAARLERAGVRGAVDAAREAGHHRDPGPRQTRRQPLRERRAGGRRLPGADDRDDGRPQQLAQPVARRRRPQVQLGRRVGQLGELGRPARLAGAERSRDAPEPQRERLAPGARGAIASAPARSAMVRATRRLRSTPRGDSAIRSMARRSIVLAGVVERAVAPHARAGVEPPVRRSAPRRLPARAPRCTRAGDRGAGLGPVAAQHLRRRPLQAHAEVHAVEQRARTRAAGRRAGARRCRCSRRRRRTGTGSSRRPRPCGTGRRPSRARGRSPAGRPRSGRAAPPARRAGTRAARPGTARRGSRGSARRAAARRRRRSAPPTVAE